MLFFHLGSPRSGARVFRRLWPRARAVSDPEKAFYRAFGLQRGTVGELIGPRVWLRALGALGRGFFIGRPGGDTLMMPGWFLVQGDQILWRHEPAHAGDHPDYPAVLQAAHR